MTDQRRRIVANWKMNGVLADLRQLAPVNAWAAERPDTVVDVALPATLIAAAAQAFPSLRIGGQDVHSEASGPFTGGISAAMLADVGAKFTLVGHSEVRAAASSTDADVARKIERAFASALDVVFCVGETEASRAAGRATEAVTAQLGASLPSYCPSNRLAIAYEPVWAIGTGQLPDLRQIDDMHCVLKAFCSSVSENRIEILYGGSVTRDNGDDIMSLPAVDGLLIGAASLSGDSLLAILDGHEA